MEDKTSKNENGSQESTNTEGTVSNGNDDESLSSKKTNYRGFSNFLKNVKGTFSKILEFKSCIYICVRHLVFIVIIFIVICYREPIMNHCLSDFITIYMLIYFVLILLPSFIILSLMIYNYEIYKDNNTDSNNSNESANSDSKEPICPNCLTLFFFNVLGFILVSNIFFLLLFESLLIIQNITMVNLIEIICPSLLLILIWTFTICIIIYFVLYFITMVIIIRCKKLGLYTTIYEAINYTWNEFLDYSKKVWNEFIKNKCENIETSFTRAIKYLKFDWQEILVKSALISLVVLIFNCYTVPLQKYLDSFSYFQGVYTEANKITLFHWMIGIAFFVIISWICLNPKEFTYFIRKMPNFGKVSLVFSIGIYLTILAFINYLLFKPNSTIKIAQEAINRTNNIDNQAVIGPMLIATVALIGVIVTILLKSMEFSLTKRKLVNINISIEGKKAHITCIIDYPGYRRLSPIIALLIVDKNKDQETNGDISNRIQYELLSCHDENPCKRTYETCNLLKSIQNEIKNSKKNKCKRLQISDKSVQADYYILERLTHLSWIDPGESIAEDEIILFSKTGFYRATFVLQNEFDSICCVSQKFEIKSIT